jgi:hypothetical protein
MQLSLIGWTLTSSKKPSASIAWGFPSISHFFQAVPSYESEKWYQLKVDIPGLVWMTFPCSELSQSAAVAAYLCGELVWVGCTWSPESSLAVALTSIVVDDACICDRPLVVEDGVQGAVDGSSEGGLEELEGWGRGGSAMWHVWSPCIQPCVEMSTVLAQYCWHQWVILLDYGGRVAGWSQPI